MISSKIFALFVLFWSICNGNKDCCDYDRTQTLADRQTMVHLFEWKWNDIARECEDFLQHYGYGAVQISPPQEHIVQVKDDDLPWWIRYQPVSYKLSSRSGNRSEFIEMVNRCNRVGIRIIVDAVLNHMTGIGVKKGVQNVSSSGDSDFDARPGYEHFPGVPYSKNDTNDFRCEQNIDDDDYKNSVQNVRNCRLVGLIDLNQGDSGVRAKMLNYLNDLVEIGVAGFRMDASKHMWPGDIRKLVDGIKNLREDVFGNNQRPFIVYEVIDRGGEAVKADEYLDIGRYTDFTYGATLTSVVRGQFKDLSDLQYLGPGYGYGSFAAHDILAFIDNHDNQRDQSPYVLTYKDDQLYVICVGFMLAWNYGYPRVMSSYNFTNLEQGPPNLGQAANYATKSVEFDVDQTCMRSSGWVCEHRWPPIREMVKFRQAVQYANITVLNAEPNSNRIAFSRNERGLFAVNNQRDPWLLTTQTTMPEGCYCEVWGGGKSQNGVCAGEIIRIDHQGNTSFKVPNGQFIAIHVQSKVDC